MARPVHDRSVTKYLRRKKKERKKEESRKKGRFKWTCGADVAHVVVWC